MMKFFVIWLAAFHLVSSLPHGRNSIEHDEEFSKSDVMKIVSKLPQNIQDLMRLPKENPKEQNIDVINDSSNGDSSYIIEDENKKRYRVKIKKKMKTTRNDSIKKGHNNTYGSHKSNESDNVDDNNAAEDTQEDSLSVHRRIMEGATENRNASGYLEKDNSSEASDKTNGSRHRAGKKQVIRITKHKTTYSKKRINKNETEGRTDVPDVIQNICQTLNIKPADVSLLANVFLDLDIYKNRDLNKLKNIYKEFITHVRENPGNARNISAFKAWLEVNLKHWNKNNKQFSSEETSSESIYKRINVNKLKNKYQDYLLNLKNQVLSNDEWLKLIYSNQNNPEFLNEVSSENMRTLENIKKLIQTKIKTTNEESAIDENDPVKMTKISQEPNNGVEINNGPKFSDEVLHEKEHKPNILKKVKEDINSDVSYRDKGESNENHNEIKVIPENRQITEAAYENNKITHKPGAPEKEKPTHKELIVDNNDLAKDSEILLDDDSVDPNNSVKNNNLDISVEVSSENVNKPNIKKINEHIEPLEKSSEILLDDRSLEPSNAIKNNDPDISVEVSSEYVNKHNLKNIDEHIEPRGKNKEINSQITTSPEDEVKMTSKNVKNHHLVPHMKKNPKHSNKKLSTSVMEWVVSPKNTIENQPQSALEITPELYEYSIDDLKEKAPKHEIQPNTISTDENSVPENVDKGKITHQNVITAIAKDNSQDDKWLDTNVRNETKFLNEVTSKNISLEDMKESKNPKIKNELPSIKEWFEINSEYLNESSPKFETKVLSPNITEVNSEASEELRKLQPTYDQKAEIEAEQKNIKNVVNKEHERDSPKTYFISTFESPDERDIDSFIDEINVKSPGHKIQSNEIYTNENTVPVVIPNKSPHIPTLEEIYEKLANTNEMKNGSDKTTVIPMLHEDTTRRHFGKTTHPDSTKLNQSHIEINEETSKKMSIPKEIDENEFVNTFGNDANKDYQVGKENYHNKHPESWDLDMFDDPTSEQNTPDNFDSVKTSQITLESQIPRPNGVLLPLGKPAPKIKETTLEEFIQPFKPNTKQPSINQDSSADKSIENIFFIEEDGPYDVNILKHTFTVPEIPGLQLDDNKSKKNTYFLLIPRSVLTERDIKRTLWYKFYGFLDSDGQFVNSKLYDDEPSPKQNYYYGFEGSMPSIKPCILEQKLLLSPLLQSMGSDLIPPKSLLDVPKPDIVYHLQKIAKDILHVTLKRFALYLSIAGAPTEISKSIIGRIDTEMVREFRIGVTKCPSNDLNIFIEMLRLKIKQYVTEPSREQ